MQHACIYSPIIGASTADGTTTIIKKAAKMISADVHESEYITDI